MLYTVKEIPCNTMKGIYLSEYFPVQKWTLYNNFMFAAVIPNGTQVSWLQQSGTF